MDCVPFNSAVGPRCDDLEIDNRIESSVYDPLMARLEPGIQLSSGGQNPLKEEDTPKLRLLRQSRRRLSIIRP